MLFRISGTARKRFARLALRWLEAYFHQKAFAVIGAAFALHFVHRRPGTISLQSLLERRFIVAQSGPGAQLFCQLFDGFSQHIAPGERPYRFESTIEENSS